MLYASVRMFSISHFCARICARSIVSGILVVVTERSIPVFGTRKR